MIYDRMVLGLKKRCNLVKRLVIILCLFIFFFAKALPSLAQEQSQAGGVLVVGVPVDRCPVFYLNSSTGEITGIGVDLMREVAEAAGYTAEFKKIGEDTLKQALDNEAYDVIMPFGSAIKSETGQASIVTDNLIQTPFTLVTVSKKELPPINELHVGMLSSLSGGAETVKELYPGIEITLYDTMADCVKALRLGKVDGLLHNSYVWSYVLEKPSYSDLQAQSASMFSMDFRAGALDNAKSKEIIDRLNEGIVALTDAKRQAIVLDHTTRRLYKYDFYDYIYEFGPILAIGSVILIMLIIIVVLKQRSMRYKHEESLRKLMDHDPLTGVLSMNGFRKKVEELLRDHPEIPYFLSYNNIKDFKFINDSLGMEAGDELLRFWADRSVKVLTDKEAIGRIEGDHFVVLRRIGGNEQMFGDDRQIFAPLRNFFVDRGKEIRVQICSGIYVLTSEDYKHINVDHMLDFARVAEKRVREVKKDGYEFYNPNQWDRGKRIADVVGHLYTAIQTGELQVWYQPQLHYEGGDIIGAEALCRWNHAKLGWIPPSEFIPTLEESGLIYDMDCFVWERVCQDLARWNREGKKRYVSVNLSRGDIQEERNIPKHFYDLVQKYELSPDQLRIEITETAYVEDSELLIKTTQKLRELGFQVEMDDFGSGYSSLNMLKEVTVDRIKLDLRFLTDEGDHERGRIIVSHVIQMVHSLGMTLLAEGVEELAQAKFLRKLGCTEMQGFYFYRPMPVHDFEKVCEKNNC